MLEDLAHGSAAARPGGTDRRAAHPLRTSVTRWPRSAATRAASSPAGPPPTTGDVTAGRLGGREPVAAPLGLAARRRVDHAGDPVVARATAPAHLVARDARPNLVGPAPRRALATRCGSAIWPRTIETMSACPAASHVLGVGRGVRMWLSAWTSACRATSFSAARERLAELGRIERRRDERVEVEVAARPAGDVVDQGALVVPGNDLLHRLDLQRRL